jgi:hypothetical protein
MQEIRCFYKVNRLCALAEESAGTHRRMPARPDAGQENMFGLPHQGCSPPQVRLKRAGQEVQRALEFQGLTQDIAFKAGGRI